MKHTVAVAQIDSTIGNLRRNVAKHVEYVRRAIDGGAEMIVFPELSLSGYSLRDVNWDVAIRLPEGKQFGELLTLSKKISIILGGVEESHEYGIFNAAFLLEDGKATSVHRKLYPPTYGMFEELRYFSAGKSVRAFDSSVGKLGVLICEDLWHLPLPYILAEDNAKVVITIAASPTRVTGGKDRLAIAEVNRQHHKTYARLLSVYLVFCNRVGYEDGINFWGGSEIVDPSGDVIAQAKLFKEDLIFADLDENEVRRARRLSRHFLDDDEHLVIEELRRVSKNKRPK